MKTRTLLLAAAALLTVTAAHAMTNEAAALSPTMPSVLLGDWCYDYAGNVNKSTNYVYHRCVSGPQSTEDITIRPFGYVSEEANLTTNRPNALTCRLTSVNTSTPGVYRISFNKCGPWVLTLADDHIELTWEQSQRN